MRKLAGSGSAAQRAQQLFQHFLGHQPDPVRDAVLLCAVTKKLVRRGNENQAVALLLSSPEDVARVKS